MPFSKEVTQKVWDRADGLCERKLPNGQRCLAPGSEFHHIVLKGMGGRHGRFKKMADSKANCMLVCLGCHRERHEGHGWNDDADSLIPGADIRLALRAGVGISLRQEKDGG